MNLATVELKAFVPARDFLRSQAFYQALGFTMPWHDDDLAYLHAGPCSFLLQRFDVEPQATQLAANLQLHLLVEDVDGWHRHVAEQRIGERFGVRVGPLQDQPWAMRDFVLFDPSGVLWRIAQKLPRAGGAPAAAGGAG